MKFFIRVLIWLAIPCCTSAQVVNISNGLKVVANGDISLVVDNGGIKNEGDYVPGNSTVFFDGASTNAISGTQPITFYNLSFRGTGTKQNNGEAAVLNALRVEGSTVVDADGTGNDKTFILRSSDSATAYVDKLENGNIIGNVTVERFINTGTGEGEHAKSWQFLATPTTGQTYFQSWQEGGLAPAGYGTWITGTGTGFDATTTAPSIKYYDQATGNWTAVTNTGGSLQNKLGYMLFVRGDRTVNTYNASANNTNMRSKGVLFTPFNPPVPVPVTGIQFQSFGNPYASRIEFQKVYEASTGINNVFYVWDPQLNGTWNAGGYQTISAVAGYIPTAGSASSNYPAGIPSPYIESGQAVLVQGNGNNGSIQFNEDCKMSGSRLVTRQTLSDFGGLPANRQFMFTCLFTNAGMIADGNIVAFENGLGNELNGLDAKKVLNSGENLGIYRNEKLLSVEARDEIVASDTIFYHMQNLRQQTYQLRFAPINLHTGLTAFLIDRFSNTSTAISTTDSSFFNFTVTADPSASAVDRFILVFQRAAIVPVQIISIAASRISDHTNLVTWHVDNEVNLQNYVVERSADGRNFNDLGNTLPIANNGGTAQYRYRDERPLLSLNFYRIRAISHSGQVQYSGIARIESDDIVRGIRVYPNPVTDNIIHIVFRDQKAGKYQLKLTNKLGQVVYSNSVQVDRDNFNYSIKPATILAAGTYQLILIAEKGDRFVEQVIVK